jgi:hypothetical protein
MNTEVTSHPSILSHSAIPRVLHPFVHFATLFLLELCSLFRILSILTKCSVRHMARESPSPGVVSVFYKSMAENFSISSFFPQFPFRFLARSFFFLVLMYFETWLKYLILYYPPLPILIPLKFNSNALLSIVVLPVRLRAQTILIICFLIAAQNFEF